MECTAENARSKTPAGLRQDAGAEPNQAGEKCRSVEHDGETQSRFGAPHRRILFCLRKDSPADSDLRVLRS